MKPKESSSSEYSSSSVIETSSSSLVATGVCKTAQEDNCVYDTLYDNHDGQTYKIVKIGEQWWMAENLRYVDSTQSVCYANNSDNCQIYGRLYTRNGALNNCPEGWRLPSEKDWLDLRDFAKKNSTNKYIGQLFRADTLWNVSELGVGYDAFGFGALPAGGYDEDGWWGVKTNSIFWLSDSYKIGTLDCFVYTRIRYKLKDNSDIQIGKEVCVQNPNSYFSVRCIKD
ncbi:FISUMP domain-containing protein [Fibrobacter sp.]|uniref:FISUMP domain-containing protein n=1 Tax=Fibrobacter sp. TaxID=35828 RepID=UPI0025C3124A|nr:FISUMP domain-containing protein [Fibrobacter sp.]